MNIHEKINKVLNEDRFSGLVNNIKERVDTDWISKEASLEEIGILLTLLADTINKVADISQGEIERNPLTQIATDISRAAVDLNKSGLKRRS